MLIEFSVSNYKSIMSQQTLSMVAGPSRAVKGRYSFEPQGIDNFRLLKTAAIFGPNASGKSTLIKALEFMQEFVIKSSKEGQEGEPIDVVPFMLHHSTREAPSEFEISFIENDIRYQYGFSADRLRVHHEWLYATPVGGRTQRWIDRSFDHSKKVYSIYVNPSLKGEREVWKRSTRDNALVLSTAVQLSAEPFRDAFRWFQRRLRVVTSNERVAPDYTASLCESEKKERILGFLNAADLGIVDVVVNEAEFKDVFPRGFPEKIREVFATEMAKVKLQKIFLGHADDGGNVVYLDLNDESDGTRVIFSLAGPLLDVLDHGRVLIVDELHNSLHPLAFQYLVERFHCSDEHSSNAQLIFTTHETHIMAGDTLHRDQIWFMSKNSQRASELASLAEFKSRNNEAFERGYLGGRYGALPNIDLFKGGGGMLSCNDGDPAP